MSYLFNKKNSQISDDFQLLFEATPTFFWMILLPEKYSRTEQATDATHYTFLSLKAAHTYNTLLKFCTYVRRRYLTSVQTKVHTL